MCILQLLQVEDRDAKKSKSWRSRLSGLFKREKKANGKDDTGGRDAGSAKTKGKTKTEVSEAPEDSAKGVCIYDRQPLPPSCMIISPTLSFLAASEPADDVNNAILNQEGLTTTEDDQKDEEVGIVIKLGHTQ